MNVTRLNPRAHRPATAALALALLMPALAACQQPQPEPVAGGGQPAVAQQSQSGAAGQASTPVADAPSAAVGCPSQDFNAFLKAYASDEATRKRFTAMPLKYKQYSYVALNGDTDENTPEWTEKDIATDDRGMYFTYRYDKQQDGYFFVGMQGMADPGERIMAPMKVDQRSADMVHVEAGSESEQDVFTFSRRNDCWYLEQAQDYRS